jgi:hypothetical protein
VVRGMREWGNARITWNFIAIHWEDRKSRLFHVLNSRILSFEGESHPRKTIKAFETDPKTHPANPPNKNLMPFGIVACFSVDPIAREIIDTRYRFITKRPRMSEEKCQTRDSNSPSLVIS